MIYVHIIIASLSLIAAAAALLAPSRNKLYVVYALTALTIATGIYLIFVMPARMAAICESGLAYTAIMLLAIGAVYLRLGKKSQSN